MSVATALSLSMMSVRGGLILLVHRAYFYINWLHYLLFTFCIQLAPKLKTRFVAHYSELLKRVQQKYASYMLYNLLQVWSYLKKKTTLYRDLQYRWPKPICKQMPSFSFTRTSTQTAAHLHTCILMNVWSTPPPMPGPSHPSALHDELSSLLATCKIKNIKHSTSSNCAQGFIQAQRLFVLGIFSFILICESLYSAPQKFCHFIVAPPYCLSIYAPSLLSIRTRTLTLLVCLWFERCKNGLTDVEADKCNGTDQIRMLTVGRKSKY